MARPFGLLAVVLLVLAASAPRAGASVARALDLAGLTRRADAIVVGTTTTRRCRWQGRRIVTDVTVRVDHPVKGPHASGEALAITHLGGEVGEVGMRVEGMPRFRVGDRTLLFARWHRSGAAMRPVAMSQGVMPIRRRNGHDMVFPGAAGLALVQRSGGGLGPAPAAVLHPRPLDEVLGELDTLVRKGTSP